MQKNLFVRMAIINGRNNSITYVCWCRYEGYFKDNNKEGYGELIQPNGDQFKGEFKNDKIKNGKICNQK